MSNPRMHVCQTQVLAQLTQTYHHRTMSSVLKTRFLKEGDFAMAARFLAPRKA